MRAGASEWDEATERAVRAAAGSACVKASATQAAPAEIREQAVAPLPAVGETDAASTAAGGDAQQMSADAGEDEEWTPLKGFKFNPVTGAPGKKPYERRREVFETEEEREH